ncbi:zinc-dependent peptidase [Geobacter sp.]|uniref:M90 family metallopeptidase n=1 Tax=Geobacter sp. TaxID=46610 RepID=UPI002631B592|nr:M90 family metallopeptidase [Geobacter sp.]
MFFLKRLRRTRLSRQEFPPPWRAIVERNVPFYHLLPQRDREELLRHTRILLAEKHFEGCGGIAVTDEIRVTVAALASILLLHRQTDYYPFLSSIVIYPDEYVGERRRWDETGVVTEGEELRVGESWEQGTVVLSWRDVLLDAETPDDGFNVVFHEFAHQLDHEARITGDDGFLPAAPPASPWREIWEREFERLRADDEAGRRTFLDPYGAESPAEFFAVAVEAFFEMPAGLREHHPELYGMLREFFRQDPAAWGRGG